MEEKIVKDTKEMIQKVKDATEKIIDCVIEDGVKEDNVDLLSKVIDIHKDVCNEEYWKVKEENYMRYGRSYSDGAYGDSYGRRGVKGTGPYSRYRDGDTYGRRGVKGTGRGRYRGHESIEDMMDMYEAYSEGKEAYGRGNYGAKDDTMQSLDEMLQSMVEFVDELKRSADNQEELELIKQYTRKISEM